MELVNYFYECKNCGTGFKSPELGGNRYGDFLMRNEAGKIVYLNSFDTPVFDEFSKIFHQNIQIINRDISDIEKADIFQEIFSVACDLASDNTPYKIARDPACPSCGKINIDHWREINPPEFIEIDIKPVTHNTWNKLSQAEKESLVDQAIKKII